MARRVDLACLALGSMLPDIIDKPLGLIVFGTPAMGRSIAHTFLSLLIIAAIAFYFHNLKLASVSGGVLSHLVLDSMWRSPVILFWPLLGNFPLTMGPNTADYLMQLMFELRNPEVLVPEVLGLSYLIYFSLQNRSIIIHKLGRVIEVRKVLKTISLMLFHSD